MLEQKKQFLGLLAKVPPGSWMQRIQLPKMYAISLQMEAYPIQDPLRFRARYIGWQVGTLLVPESGKIDRDCLHALIKGISETPFPVGFPDDAEIFAHVLNCLQRIDVFAKVIKKFSLPLAHKRAEHIVRETLWPDEVDKLSDIHIQRAALIAWLTPLRQATGSCFATAPAILVQRDQPERFFKDLLDLLNVGSLRRVVEGKEWSAPCSITSGEGDLFKPLGSVKEWWKAPGIKAALGDIDVDLETTPVTVDELLRQVLLIREGLTEKDLATEETSESNLMEAMVARQGAIHYQRPNEKKKQVARWKKALKAARSTFRLLTEASLLRAWEYTIASFADVKVEFARWNLYIGLGLDAKQPGGLGDALYQSITQKLQAANQDAAEQHRVYETAFYQVRSLEALMGRSDTDARRHQRQTELISAVHAAQAAESLRDKASRLAEAYSHSFTSLIGQIDAMLQTDFQEVFDPSLQVRFEGHVYDDSPAGFRLLYKQGRIDAASWSLIHSEKEYVNALCDFFVRHEPDFELPKPLDRAFVSDTITEIVQFLRTQEFIDAAFRFAYKHGRQSPWDYISGGTLQTLVQNYYGLSQAVTERACVPRSIEEVMAHFSVLPVGVAFLVHSPTHAFIGKLAPVVKHEPIRIDYTEAMEETLVEKLSETLPDVTKPLFLHRYRQIPDRRSLRDRLIEAVGAIVRRPDNWVDAFLYETLPLHPRDEAQALLVEFGRAVQASRALPHLEQAYITSDALQATMKAWILQETQAPFSKVDWDLMIIEFLRNQKKALPKPYLFADTNWAGWTFGWCRNPMTGAWELWRFNRTATKGVPMHEWEDQYGPSNQLPWVILTNREEYTARG
ncbi:MAG: hypothetical protein RL235_437 [Chlamydiota bacterium]